MKTFGELLAGHAEEQHEMFQHLQACCLSAGDSAQVASLLEAIGGEVTSQLRSAHSAWGLPQKGTRPCSQRREDEGCLAAEAAHLASAFAFGCIMGVCSRKFKIAIEPIPSGTCTCSGGEKVGEGFVLSGHHSAQHGQ